jgi:hypothetical protein
LTSTPAAPTTANRLNRGNVQSALDRQRPTFCVTGVGA